MREYIKNQPKICTLDSCNRLTRAKGFCTLHYDRFKKFGDPEKIIVLRNGQTKIPEYGIWSGMKTRCYNPNVKKFNRYGGRGIIICDRWLNSFPDFYEDMGKRPTPKHQIDRIDNNGNYEPLNCRWILPADNARNSSPTKLTKEQVKEI